MKRTLLFAFCLYLLLPAHAQQRPHYTQYVLNPFILNPALTGIENYTDLKLSARDQWVGLEGAPRTAYLSVHGPIGKKDYKTTATSFGIPGENPRGKAYWENYTASAPHHGIGLTLINDRTGLFNRFSVAASYAYHIGLSARSNLSAGFSGGFSHIGFNAAKAQAADPNDPALAGGGTPFRIRPDVGAGIWFYSSRFMAGISAQQVIPQQLGFAADPAYSMKLIPHYFITGGYRFLISESINALPSVLVKGVSGAANPVQFDANIKLQYLDMLWIGGSYRLQDGYAAMLGLNAANTFHVSYAYDFTRTALNTASRGTHELIIGFLLGNRYGDTCPRNVW